MDRGCGCQLTAFLAIGGVCSERYYHHQYNIGNGYRRGRDSIPLLYASGVIVGGIPAWCSTTKNGVQMHSDIDRWSILLYRCGRLTIYFLSNNTRLDEEESRGTCAGALTQMKKYYSSGIYAWANTCICLCGIIKPKTHQ